MRLYPLCSLASQITPQILTFLRQILLHGVLIGLDHFLNHLSAHGTGLLCSNVAVVALLQVYTNFICCFHLKSLHCFLCFRNQSFIACHCFDSPILNGLLACKPVPFRIHQIIDEASNQVFVSLQPFFYLYDRAHVVRGSVTIVRFHSQFMSGKNFIFRGYFSFWYTRSQETIFKHKSIIITNPILIKNRVLPREGKTRLLKHPDFIKA